MLVASRRLQQKAAAAPKHVLPRQCMQTFHLLEAPHSRRNSRPDLRFFLPFCLFCLAGGILPPPPKCLEENSVTIVVVLRAPGLVSVQYFGGESSGICATMGCTNNGLNDAQ